MTYSSRRSLSKSLVHHILYTDIDPYCCQWTRNLISRGLIPNGDVVCSDIKDLDPDELNAYAQCHFFNGVSGFPYALTLASWPSSRRVWTGSCPCPSFSVAGQGQGFSDPRHLWPDWYRLIAICHPSVIFGEQSPAAISHGWLDLVHSDLEASGYAVGAAVLGACSVGAPHRRQRLYFAAELLADSTESRCNGQGKHGGRPSPLPSRPEQRSPTVELAHPNGRDSILPDLQRGGQHGLLSSSGRADSVGLHPGPTNGFWRDADWLLCTDGLFRATQPLALQISPRLSTGMGSMRSEQEIDGVYSANPLVTGTFARVSRLRGYGNSLTVQVAAKFIRSYMETTDIGPGVPFAK